MRKINTRFNPTANGELHIGHAYTVLVNEFEAHRTGGKFILRFEDNQPHWNIKIKPYDVNCICARMLGDLEWLGIKVDDIKFESEMVKEVDHYISYLDKNKILGQVKSLFDFPNCEISWSECVPYPYAPHLTARRVVMDYISGCNHIIRGEDLVSEYSLYAFFCEVFGLPCPRIDYIPRLRYPNGDELLLEVSKTTGTKSIRSYREQGISPERLMNRLRIACLEDPKGDWSIRNTRRSPTWVF